MNRRTFILILAVLLFTGAGIGAYYLIVKKSGQEPTPVASEQPKAPEAQLIAAEVVISPVLSFNGETVWFMSQDGRLYRQAITPGAMKEEYLLPVPVEGPQRAVWQQQGSDFIVEQTVVGHTRYQFYSTGQKAFVPYDPAVREPAFLADDKQIVYIWVGEGGKNELTVSAPNSQNYKKLSDLYRPDYQLVVSPAKNQVLLFADDAANPDNLLLVNLDTVAYTLLDEKVAYQGARFSPDGNFAVVVKAGNLALYDLSSGNSSPLGGTGEVGGISVDQTAWSKDSNELYVVERNSIRAYSLPTQEWRDVYAFPAGSPRVPVEIFLHPIKNTLFFTDSATGYLYRLDLE